MRGSDSTSCLSKKNGDILLTPIVSPEHIHPLLYVVVRNVIPIYLLFEQSYHPNCRDLLSKPRRADFRDLISKGRPDALILYNERKDVEIKVISLFLV